MGKDISGKYKQWARFMILISDKVEFMLKNKERHFISLKATINNEVKKLWGIWPD